MHTMMIQRIIAITNKEMSTVGYSIMHAHTHTWFIMPSYKRQQMSINLCHIYWTALLNDSLENTTKWVYIKTINYVTEISQLHNKRTISHEHTVYPVILPYMGQDSQNGSTHYLLAMKSKQTRGLKYLNLKKTVGIDHCNKN